MEIIEEKNEQQKEQTKYNNNKPKETNEIIQNSVNSKMI